MQIFKRDTEIVRQMMMSDSPFLDYDAPKMLYSRPRGHRRDAWVL